MACPECTAPGQRRRTYCAVCDANLVDPGAPGSRQAEAACYCAIAGVIRADEALLGFTRGCVTGSWADQASHPVPSLSLHFANLGLTSNRLVLQPVAAASGEPQDGLPLFAEIAEIAEIAVTDADTHVAWQTVRLEVTLRDGRALRLRARARHARSARTLAEAWSAVRSDLSGPADEVICQSCGRMCPALSRFCPYCGSRREEQ